MKVLITQHFFRSDASSFPAELTAACPAELLAPVSEGFAQEVVEVDRLIEAVAYDCGLEVEDLTETPPDDTWVETPYGIFISSDTQCVSYVILEAESNIVQLH
ncbi:hypothetical protein D3C75_223990 [compost metagenome]